MVIEYESESSFRLAKSNSASEYDTTPSELFWWVMLWTMRLQLFSDHIIIEDISWNKMMLEFLEWSTKVCLFNECLLIVLDQVVIFYK
jgi:hypothetical protein